MRQPLEDGRVVVVRSQRAAIFPTRFMLVAATNPCPCGYLGEKRCRCTESDQARHRRRLSGPLLDRIDLLLHVNRPSAAELAGGGDMMTSADAREKVVAARARQAERGALNAHLTVAALRRFAAPERAGRTMLTHAYEEGRVSARGHDRVLRVARTLADLAGRDTVAAADVAVALGFRQDAAEIRRAA
jgi:magnesium chelatase family protein